MAIDSRRILHQLGRGESVDDVRAAAGLTEAEFEAWWNRELQRRLAVIDGRASGPVAATVEIQRDASGLPHIYAEEETDLFVGYGYAMAQDRLFQMDYLRRRALGRLAEILGPEAFDYDLLVRTVGLHRIAAEETARLPAETAERYEAFATGVNALYRGVPRPAADRVRPARLSAGALAAARLDCAAGRVSLVSHGAVSGDCGARAGQARPGRGCPLRSLPNPRGDRRDDSASRRVRERGQRHGPGGAAAGRDRRRHRQQQLGRRPEPQRFRRGARGQRSAHRLRLAVLLVSSPPGRRTVQRGGGRICGGAGHHLRSQPARRLGHHEQHQLAARSLPGAHGPGASRRIPL